MDQADPSAILARIEVAQLLERSQLSAFHYRLIILSCLITFFDGLDLMMISYTAPYLRGPLGLDASMLGRVFAAATVGQIIGGLVFPYLADMIGRRPVILGTAFLFGVLTLATSLAHDYHSLLILRFTNGIAIGGMLPIAWALNIEAVPRRMRATVVTVIMLGYSFGSAFAGPMTNMLAPTHGWQAVFIAGGIATLMAASLLALFLPESVRHMVSRNRDAARIAKALAAIQPGFKVQPGMSFHLGDEDAKQRHFNPRDLFAGDLAAITPVLWLAYFASALAIFFTSSWGPTLLEALDTPRKLAALISAFSGMLGALSGVLLLRFTEKRGPRWIMLYPALAVPVLFALGFGFVPRDWFYIFVILGGLLIGGSHAAVISIAGIYYPSAIRANGAGWATSFAKVGGVLAPLIGAVLIGGRTPPIHAYAALSICPAIIVIAIFSLSRIVESKQVRTPHV